MKARSQRGWWEERLLFYATYICSIVSFSKGKHWNHLQHQSSATSATSLPPDSRWHSPSSRICDGTTHALTRLLCQQLTLSTAQPYTHSKSSSCTLVLPHALRLPAGAAIEHTHYCKKEWYCEVWWVSKFFLGSPNLFCCRVVSLFVAKHPKRKPAIQDWTLPLTLLSCCYHVFLSLSFLPCFWSTSTLLLLGILIFLLLLHCLKH